MFLFGHRPVDTGGTYIHDCMMSI